MNKRYAPTLLLSGLLASTGVGAVTPDAVTATTVVQAAAMFDDDSTRVASERVPCTLSGGTETTCLKISVTALQTEHKMGPWCPRNIADGAEDAGIWLEGDKVYDADGKFMENLAAFYKDDEWQIYEKATGAINVTDSKEACEAAARPDVDPQYQNHCVECLPSYVDSEHEQVYLIPAKPVLTDGKPAAGSGRGRPGGGMAGLAFNGVRFDAPAPTHAILGAHTIAPFDDCGGHVNPHVGYHYHAVTGCTEGIASEVETHANMIGLAMDGFPLYARQNAEGDVADDLDACGGHTAETLGYHYHAGAPGTNQILACFKAETGCQARGDDNNCMRRGRRGPPPGNRPPPPGAKPPMKEG